MPAKKKQSFAKMFEELEEITKWFDSEEQIDLDLGLKKFERGLALANDLKKRLADVENSVEEIKKKFSE